ncbi:hypothetical protein C8R44DRAFT_740464 [Mycena epipterygia]|nr:hypothetical protein C8R44DRAFT_740464 [Mycena epipterygia]
MPEQASNCSPCHWDDRASTSDHKAPRSRVTATQHNCQQAAPVSRLSTYLAHTSKGCTEVRSKLYSAKVAANSSCTIKVRPIQKLFFSDFSHDILTAVLAGTRLVLCEHTSTDCGYLPTLANKLFAELNDLDFEVIISQTNAHPLQFV